MTKRSLVSVATADVKKTSNALLVLLLAAGATLVLAFAYRGLFAADAQLRTGLAALRVDDTAAVSALLRAHLNDIAKLLGAALLLAFAVPAAALYVVRRGGRATEARLATLAMRDPLTGLAHRAEFAAALDRVHEAAIEARRPMAIIHIDIDRLKEINDVHGTRAGDAVLRTLARRFAGRGGVQAQIGRIGDDEMGIATVLPVADPQGEALARDLLAAAGAPIGIDGRELRVSASIGLMLVEPGDAASFDAQRALGCTAIAVAAAKAEGANRCCRFVPEMDSALRRRRAVEQWVRQASAAQRFELHYQPLFDARRPALVGCEVLLRLRSPEGELVSPAEFIPVAEEIGLISAIGRWVLERACEAAARWPQPLSVAVNLSPAQFLDDSVCESVRGALGRTGLAPSRLQLEITEGLMMHDSEAVLRELRALKALGVSIVMDDFGTGYSSLSYLWRFPFDKIKIDRAFVGALQDDGTDVGQIVRTIVALGHALGIRVNAEGVETPAQAEFLRALGCDELQGFLLGRPQPEAAVQVLIDHYHGDPRRSDPARSAEPAH